VGSPSAGGVEVASPWTACPEKFYQFAAAGTIMDYWVGQGKGGSEDGTGKLAGA